MTERPGWSRSLVAFATIFALYQASEGLQTVFAPESPIGPALMLAALLVAWPLGRWLGGSGFGTYGLERFRALPLLLVGGFVLAGLAKYASIALGPGEAQWTDLVPTAGAIGLALTITFVPSVVEDILTRGYLLRVFPLQLGGISYVILSAALYTLNHIWRFDWGWSEQVRLFALGLAYAAAAWRWRSLWAAVALHWGWNFANAVLGPMVDIEGLSVDAGRMASAAAHLALLAIVLMLPARKHRAVT